MVPAPSLQHHSCVLSAFAFCSVAFCCLLGVFLVGGGYLGLLEQCVGVALTAEPVWFPGTPVRLAGCPWLVSLGTDRGCLEAKLPVQVIGFIPSGGGRRQKERHGAWGGGRNRNSSGKRRGHRWQSQRVPRPAPSKQKHAAGGSSEGKRIRESGERQSRSG